jgi:hypothetical protein
MDVRNRPMNEHNPVASVVDTGHGDRGGGGWLSKILAVSLILAAVVATYASRAVSGTMSDMAVKSKAYQAVFLTNGQVYFCKLSKVDASYVKCQDIYYLQVQQQVQPKDQNQQQQPQVSLAKLGGELHGPEDVMYVARQQVLFWENLKDEGKVTKAIKDYKAQGTK